MPYYAIQDFIDACKDKRKVYIIRGAQETAGKDFKLKTDEQILAFIVNQGLEKKEFINTKEWENNPNPSKPVMVDAYHFYSGDDLYGYIAFLFNPKTNKWVIKSFKSDPEADPRNFPLRNNEVLQNLKMKLEGQGE